MLETAIQERERTEPHFHHILLAKQVTRPVFVARGADPEMGTVGAILATHLYITSCSGLNGVLPSTNSCVPRTSEYDLIWKYSKSPTCEPSSCKLSKVQTCTGRSSRVSYRQLTCLAAVVTRVPPPQAAVPWGPSQDHTEDSRAASLSQAQRVRKQR